MVEVKDGGGLRAVSDPLAEDERQKYQSIWAHDDYRAHSPGEGLVDAFMAFGNFEAVPEDQRGNILVLDLGCGTGRAAREIQNRGFGVVGIDFVPDALEADIPFINACLWEIPSDLSGDYAICSDVMEHIPPERIDQTLGAIKRAVRCGTLFRISTVPDRMGALIGKPLHLTVKSPGWWERKLKKHFSRVERAVETDDAVVFMAGETFQRIFISIRSNVPDEGVTENIKSSLSRELPDVKEAAPHRRHVAIVGGGPSLVDTLPQLQALQRAGADVLALNGAHDWLIENGVQPKFHAIMDSRPENADFVQEPRKSIAYLMCSGCAPEVFEALQGFKVRLWHVESAASYLREDQPYLGSGGTTIGIHALPLVYLMGYRSVHLFGYDSSCRGETGHAYPQVLNDRDKDTLGTYRVDEDGPEFVCAPWMAAQVNEFHRFVIRHSKEMRIQVYGDGLLPYVAKKLSCA